MEITEIYTPAIFYSHPATQVIRSKLHLNGIDCSCQGNRACKIATITWVENIPPENILAHIRELHLADYKIIVLNTCVSLPDGIKWQLIANGAGDIIDWQDEEVAITIIHARIKRWRAIEELLASNIVREKMIGESRVWKNFIRKIIEVAYFTNNSVLLAGESGTGKELTANLIHHMDRRKDKGEFVLLDCTTVVPELFGSEFYGHEKGAFTNGFYSREGVFALADNGSLFLDELGELPLTLQAGLLRVIQEKTFKKVGSNSWRKTNFRLICATNKDIKAEIAQGYFRKDLYYRIASSIFTMPTLHERREDIPELIRYFLREELKTIVAPRIDITAMNYLVMRDYPGNIRELKQLVKRIAVRYTGEDMITIGDMPDDEIPLVEKQKTSSNGNNLTMQQSLRLSISGGKDLTRIKQDIANLAMEIALEDCNGNLKLAAKKLNVEVRTLQYLRKKNGPGNIK